MQLSPLKAKARASAYFTKLGWRRWCVFVGGVGVCVGVCVGGVYMCIRLGWLGCVRRVGCIEGGVEEKLHHYIIFVTLSSLVHEKKILSPQPDKDDQNWKQKLHVFKIKRKALFTIQILFYRTLHLFPYFLG